MSTRLQRGLILLGGLLLIGISAWVRSGASAVAATDWIAPVLIPPCSQQNGNDGQMPTLAISGRTTHAVWVVQDDSYPWLCHSTRSGEQWEPRPMDMVGDLPALAVGRDGSISLVYSDFDSSRENYEVFYTRLEASGWSLPLPVSDTPGSSLYPDIAVAPNGRHYVVWVDDTGATDVGQSQIYFGWSSSDGPHYFPIPSSDGVDPHIAVDSLGRIHVVWTYAANANDPLVVQYTRCDDPPLCLAWTTPEIVSTNDRADSAMARLVIGKDDSVHVVWEERRQGQPSRILYSTRTSDVGWTDPVQISASTVDAIEPSLAVDASGGRHAAWIEGNAIVTASNTGAGWNTPAPIASNLSGVADPVLYPGPAMTLHAAWAQRNGTGRDEIYYSRRDLFPHALYLPFLSKNGR